MTRRSDDRRIVILQALRDGPRDVSGELLASKLGMSRVAVRKHIEALRELGYEIDARAGEGYTLVNSPDAPLPLEVRPRLHEGFYPRLEGGRLTRSTNDDARALALDGAPEGTAVLAAAQTDGRGRLGRAWSSPPGGVYVSVVLRPAVETPEAIVLPLVVGLGVARGLDTLGVQTLLKWPNDLLCLDGRKVAGVLLEGLSEGWLISWIVAGVGINVRSAPDPERSASVDELFGRRVPLADVAAAVLDGIAVAYRRWQVDGFASFAAEYEARSYLAGRQVCVSDAAGRLLAQGKVAGIDALGRLLVATEAGVVPIVAGDVTLRED